MNAEEEETPQTKSNNPGITQSPQRQGPLKSDRFSLPNFGGIMKEETFQ